MNPDHINREFLDPVLSGASVDTYYHLGLASDDAVMERFRDLSAVVMAGSGARIRSFADRWSARNGDAEIISVSKEDRFVTRYCAGVMFVSHGMGMPSASIALQEVMRLAYFVHRGDLEALSRVMWARVGTSGGIGLPPGTVVATSEAVMADLRPFRVLRGTTGEHVFESSFPARTRHAIIEAGRDAEHDRPDGRRIEVVEGRTVCADEFFLEQYRLDGAIRLDDEPAKRSQLEQLAAAGFANIEMEGAVFAAYLNHWGFPDFAMVCVTLLDRLTEDQVTATPDELRHFADDAGEVLLRTLAAR